MLVLFACFDFAPVTVVLLNLSSVFSCIICLLQCDNMKDAAVARLGNLILPRNAGGGVWWPIRGVGGPVWSAVSDPSVRVQRARAQPPLCYIHMMFTSVKAGKHHFFSPRGCVCQQQQCIRAEFGIDFSYLTFLINNRKWAHFILLGAF